MGLYDNVKSLQLEFFCAAWIQTVAGTDVWQEYLLGCFDCAYLAQPQSLPGIFIFGIGKKIQVVCYISTKQGF